MARTLRVSANRRYLEWDDGQPFFYLADTAWGLFYNITMEETEHYLQVRKAQGFSVIMPVLIWALRGTEHLQDRVPFLDEDPLQPNPIFWEHVDRVVARANALGLVMALLPSWGHFVAPEGRWGPPLVNPGNARAYGRFLGLRYRDANVIWVLGGDRNPLEPEYLASWEELALGLTEGDGGRHLMTYHPTAVRSSSEWLHERPWLDFNMWQTSTRMDVDYVALMRSDYQREPTKPFLDGETRYEHSHRYFWQTKTPCGVRMTPKRVRQAAYYAMLSGALGHTYGCRDAWSFFVPSDRPAPRDVDTHWRRAIRFPAAEQMRHFRRLFEMECPWQRLVPISDDSLVLAGSMEGNLRIQGALAADGSYAVIYVPDAMVFQVDLGRLSGEAVDAYWFDPRTGDLSLERRYYQKGATVFHWKANPGEEDHLLVLRAR